MSYINLDDLVEQTRTAITKLSTPCPRAVVWDPKLARYVDNSNAVAAWHLERVFRL